MNLHDIAAPIIGVVNPSIKVTLIRSATTYTTAPDGTRVPDYIAPETVIAQVQALSFDELHQVNGLNLSGEKRGVYLYGKSLGILRADKANGDLITLPDGTNWLVVFVFEQWSDWVKVAITRQVAP